MRNIKRQGPNKNTNNVSDIISLFHSLEVDKVHIFVARVLSNLPPLSHNHFETSNILSEIENLKVMIQGKNVRINENDSSKAPASGDSHESEYSEFHRSALPGTETGDTLTPQSSGEDQSHNCKDEETGYICRSSEEICSQKGLFH